MKYAFIFLFSFLIFQKLVAQKTDNQDKRVHIISAGSIEFETKNGESFRYFKSNENKKRVILKRGITTFHCNTAIQNQTKNTVHAYGNVLIKTEDGNTVSGDVLDYNNNTGIAEVTGDTVILHDGKTTITTKHVFYNVTTKDARYIKGGVVETDSTILTSEKGYLWSKNKTIAFKENVFLQDTIGKQELRTDTLTYNTQSRIAYIYTTTNIKTAKETIITQGGNYNTRTQKVQLSGHSWVDTKEYTLSANNFYYDKLASYSTAKGKVSLFSKKDSMTIYGDKMLYQGENYSNTRVYGNALMEKPFGKDTLYLAADTLISLNDTLGTSKKMTAHYNVSIFSNNMQGKCDSLLYDFSDSVIYFFEDPILWNASSQLTAEKIHTTLKNNAIEKMYMDTKAFIIQTDILGNYNQIKGRNTVASFVDSEIREVNVNGNGQSLYFATEGDSLLIGMNKVDCSNIVMKFEKHNKPATISFVTEPESKFFPPQQLSEPDKRLPSFKYRFSEKPRRAFMMKRKVQSLSLHPNDEKKTLKERILTKSIKIE